jgi:uncharacterized small protein (DUF1192 family)
MAGSIEWDDTKPRTVSTAVIGEKLDDFSVADLEQRVKDLQAEISRVTAIIAGKKSHTSAADALFKKPS